MEPVIFTKGEYSVTFPTDALNKLCELTQGVEKFNVEVNAKLPVKHGKVREVLFPSLEEVIVIDTMLPFEIKANDRRYFDDIGNAIKRMREDSYDMLTGRVDMALAKKNLIKLREILVTYDARFSFTNGKVFDPAHISMILGETGSIGYFVNELKGKSAYASEWFSSKPLHPFRIIEGTRVQMKSEKRDFVPDEVIRIHNHPVGYPSPPSCWIRENKIKGDVSEIFKGGTYGNLLSRGQGQWELVLFREDDVTNLPKYVKLFSDFWGLMRDRSEVADDMRRLALKPIVAERKR